MLCTVNCHTVIDKLGMGSYTLHMRTCMVSWTTHVCNSILYALVIQNCCGIMTNLACDLYGIIDTSVYTVESHVKSHAKRMILSKF